jgi:hypothetical protein
MYICKICGKECKDGRTLSGHVLRIHKIKPQGYYTIYFQKGNEHICSLEGCNNFNKFNSMQTGYSLCCCQSHATKHPQTQKKLKQSRLDHYGDENYGCFGSNRFKEVMIDKYGVDNYFKHPNFIQIQKDNKEQLQIKKEETCIKNYGVKYYLQSKEGKINFTLKKDIMKENYNSTCQEKYGVDWYSQTEESINNRKIKITEKWELKTQDEIDEISFRRYKAKLKNGSIIQKEFYTEWERYIILVNRFTRKNIKKLLEDWDGTDYYTKEIIKFNDYSHTNKLYPSIDHKISKLYGFNNNISPEEIGSLSNLCITTRSTNSSKNYRTEEEYLKFLQNKKRLE